ncbi:MAG: ABC transporter permease [Clostridia bacterium]|nr:ABC transporter permease [Clostridia bacterium]
MNSAKRLLRKPLLTLIWILLVSVMTGFLAVGSSLFLSTNKLAKTLDSSHTAIAVRAEPEEHIEYAEDGTKLYSYADGTFTLEDKAAIEAFPSVKKVRSHILTGGTSPSFNPIIDIQRALSWRAEGQLSPYWNTIIVGRVHSTGVEDGHYNSIGVNVEEFYLVNSELSEAVLAVQAVGGMLVVFDAEGTGFEDWESCFEMGERYIFSGQFEPQWITYSFGRIGDEQGALHMMYWPGQIEMHDGVMMSVYDMMMINEDGEQLHWPNDGKYPLWSFPLFAKLEGDMSADEFFSTTDKQVWRDYRDALELQQHSLPVIGTDKLETTYAFLTEKARIVEGRTFTDEEYEQGAKVMVVSDRMAKLGGISVGDTVNMRQYICVGSDLSSLGYTLRNDPMNNPGIGDFDMNNEYGPEEEFTVVGIYHLVNDWTEASFAFTPNTVFIPRSAQIEGGFGEIRSEEESKTNIAGFDITRNLYGVYLSIEINNGMVDDFRKSIEETRFAGEFFAFDQGFETVQKSFNGLSVSARRILILSIIGWLLFLPLFLILFQGHQKSNVGIMRSLGSKPYKQTLYLFISGMTVVVIGVAIGTLLSKKVLDLMQTKILKDAFEGLDKSTSPASLEIAQKSLEDMVSGSALPMKTLVVIGLMQIAAFTVPVIIHAIALAHTSPRKLKG